MSEPETITQQNPEPEKKKEKLVHPLDPKKQVDTRVKEPLKNINRQLAVTGNIRSGSTEINGELLKQAGYSPSYSEAPTRVVSKKTFQELLEEKLPDHKVLDQHNALVYSRKLEHMVFPPAMDDDEIVELLVDVNCIVRKIVHGEQAKHVYFWSHDNKSIKDGLDMVYKLKGRYTNENTEQLSKYHNLSTQELVERRKKALAFFKKKPVEPTK